MWWIEQVSRGRLSGKPTVYNMYHVSYLKTLAIDIWKLFEPTGIGYLCIDLF